MEWFDLASAVGFYALVLLFVYRNRSKFERQFGVMFLYRMKVGLEAMYSFGRKYALIIKFLATIGVIAGFYFMLLLPQALFASAYKILTVPDTPAQVTLLLPGIQVPGSSFFIPFWYGIISLIIVVFVHETAHGVAAAAEGIKSKNDGLGFLLFIPLFFVEPDEKQLNKRGRMARMRIIAAGSMANLLTALVVVLLLSYAVSPFIDELFTSNGVLVAGVREGFPAQQSGLAEGVVITSVNGTSVNGTLPLVQYLDNTRPGDDLVVSGSGEEYLITLTSNPDNSSESYLGVTFSNNIVRTGFGESLGFLTDLSVIFSKFLTWLGFLSLAIGVMNFLPVFAVDGGQLFFTASTYFFRNEKTAMKFAASVFWFVLLLLLFNIVGPFLF